MIDNSKCKDLIKTALFACITLIAVCVVSYVTADKNKIRKTEPFFQSETDYDVLLFGSSHMEVTINPMDWWKEYGITSYNFGNPEEGIHISYWVMENAIKYHKPKVIVLDTYMFGLGNRFNEWGGYLHNALDSFPMTKNKFEAIADLCSDTSQRMWNYEGGGQYAVLSSQTSR